MVPRLMKVSQLVFFGLGAQLTNCYGQLVLVLGREPDYLCDNNPQKWGKPFLGKLPISPEQLKHLAAQYSELAVVVTIRKYEPIVDQLQAMGIQNVFVACFDRSYDIVFAVKKPASLVMFKDSQGQERLFRDQWTLITGSNRGIGKVIAETMAQLGSNLILHARTTQATADVAHMCRQKGAQVKTISADFGDIKQVEDMLERLDQAYPPVDILFNNAGICHPNTLENPWHVYPSDNMRHYTVNTVAPMLLCGRLIPKMIARGFGRIINISSTLERDHRCVAYACSKAALNKFVYDTSPALRNTGVSMCLVCPGHVRTNMGGREAPHDVKSVIPGVLLGAVMGDEMNGRWIIAQDFAGLSLHQALEKARWYYGLEQKHK